MIDGAGHLPVPGKNAVGEDDCDNGRLNAYDAAIVDARLGRPARDLLEATVYSRRGAEGRPRRP